MIKLLFISWVLLTLAGCSGTDLSASAPPRDSKWHQAGYRDAMAGKAVRDNDTLTEWYAPLRSIEKTIYRATRRDRPTSVARRLCVRGGEKGRNFPASCDGIADAEQLRQQ